MAMGMPGLGGGKGEPPQTFGSLTIERRVLLTPSRTISIPNISTIATRTIYESNAKALVTLGLVLLSSGGLISLLTSSWGLALVGIAIVLFIAAASSGSSTNFLIITTNDGTRSLFSGPREETLEQVRRLLSDKINAHDETATYNINFETGTIESLNVAAIAKLETAAVVNGSNNQVVANSPEARIGTKNTILTAINSPGAQLGRGIVANGNANTVQKTHIDYATVLPQIEQMQRFYAQNPHARPVEERLAELELLMRSGTPTAESRSRVRDLAGDLSTLLQGYPAMVQFFQSIVQLAGF